MTVWKSEQLPGDAPSVERKAPVKDMTQAEACALAWDKLTEALQAIDAAKYPDLAIRLSNAILDRVQGKPTATVTVNSTTTLINSVKADTALLQRVRQELITDATYETVNTTDVTHQLSSE